MLIGYARVSTVGQDPALPLDALHQAGCGRLSSDRTSGARIDRPGLAAALSHARAGDMLVVWKLDRLGRTTKCLVDLAAELANRNIGLRSLTDGIDTSGTAGKLVFHIMAAMAEMERDLVRERTNAALEAARARGRIGGCKPVMTPGKLAAARKLLSTGTRPRDVAAAIGVSIATLYRHCPAGSYAGEPMERSDLDNLHRPPS